MVKILKLSNGILSLVLILYVLLIAVFAPLFFKNPVFYIFPAVYILQNVLLFVLNKGIAEKSLSGLSALFVLLFFISIILTPFKQMKLAEGAKYIQTFSRDTLTLHLLEFDIRGRDGQLSYKGTLLIDGDTLTIGRSGAKRYGFLHLAGLSHTALESYVFYTKDTLRLFEGQTGKLGDTELTLISYDPEKNIVAFRYHDIQFNHPLNVQSPFLNEQLKIVQEDEVFAALLTYREIMPVNVFVAAAALFILLLNTIMIFRKSQIQNIGTD